jgi:hypothetical protein
VVAVTGLAAEFVKDCLLDGRVARLTGDRKSTSRLIDNDNVLVLMHYFKVLYKDGQAEE